jgi:hypothetical protein
MLDASALAVTKVAAATCPRWFPARGFIYPENGGDTFLRNVGSRDLHGATSQNTAFFMYEIGFDEEMYCLS